MIKHRTDSLLVGLKIKNTDRNTHGRGGDTLDFFFHTSLSLPLHFDRKLHQSCVRRLACVQFVSAVSSGGIVVTVRSPREYESKQNYRRVITSRYLSPRRDLLTRHTEYTE